MIASRILTSLGITIGISAALAYILTYFGASFIKTFVLIFILHFFIFGIIHYITGILTALRLRDIETQQMQSLDSQGVYVNCAFCGAPSFVPVILNSPNSFTCTECHKENAILIAVEAAHPTEPIEELDPSTVIREALENTDEADV